MVFGGLRGITVGQECARAALIVAYGLVLTRVAGRRVFGKWAALDIVVSVIVGSSLSRTLTGNAPLIGTLAATFVVVAIHGLLGKLVARWPMISRALEGCPVEIAAEGELIDGARIRNSLSEADIHEALRQSGIENLKAAQRITLEPSGALSVIKHRSN